MAASLLFGLEQQKIGRTLWFIHLLFAKELRLHQGDKDREHKEVCPGAREVVQ